MATLLLNWRVWAALAFMAAEIWGGYKLHHAGYEEGRAEVQQQFTLFKEQALEQAMAAQVARNAETQAMQAKNKEVTANYESLKVATGTAVLALDAARMRAVAELAASRDSSAPIDTSTGLPADATSEDRVVAECFGRYEQVARDAQEISDTLRALQAYVTGVVPKP